MNRVNDPVLCCLLFALLLIGGGGASPAHAQTQGAKRLVQVPISDAPSYAKRALVVGVTDYALAPQLHVCANDAKEFAQLLKDKFGFADVTLMTDEKETPATLRPTRTNLRRAVHALLNGIEPGKSEVVLFYSGHGTRYGDSDWLVPEDGDPQDVSGTCLNYSQIVQAVNTARPARTLLVTDACRSLLSGKGVGGSGFGKGLEGQSLGPEVAELLSCAPTEVSQEGMAGDFGESVFTHFLVKGLEGAPEAMEEGTKNVTFDSLMEYLRGSVSGYVRSRFNGSQTPDGRATLGRMVLAHVDALPPLVPAPLITPPVITPTPQPTEAPVVRMMTTKGLILIKLFPKDAPISCANFEKLVKAGFYNGLTFHRTADLGTPGQSKIVQGGDPMGDGSGGPGYEIKGEFTNNGVNNPLTHVQGAVAMARAKGPNSAGSQFYICINPVPFLDGDYAVFGQVITGLDVASSLQIGDKMTKVMMTQ